MNRVVFSSNSDHWRTPQETYKRLDAEFQFTFDPCPHLSAQDGLKNIWNGRVFCNPPYSKISEFIRKGLFHLASGDCELLVFLVPSRTDTAWFHDYCLSGAEIRFLRGRLKFGAGPGTAPFPSMIAVFREWKLETLPMEAAC